MMVGGKSDLAQEKRVVELAEAEAFQAQYKIPYLYETSSKSGYNNQIIFQTLTEQIRKDKNIPI